MKKLLLIPLLAVAAYGQDIQTGNTLVDGVQYHAVDFNNMVNSATILPTFLSTKGTGSPINSDLFLFYQGSSSSLKTATLTTLFSNGLNFTNQGAKTFWAGPPTGGAAVPTFRTLLPHDVTVASNSTVSATIDTSLARTFTRTLTANTSYTITGMIDGDCITVLVRQAASGGPWTATFPGISWRGGTAPVQTATASKGDLYTIINIGGVGYGTASQNFP